MLSGRGCLTALAMLKVAPLPVGPPHHAPIPEIELGIVPRAGQDRALEGPLGKMPAHVGALAVGDQVLVPYPGDEILVPPERRCFQTAGRHVADGGQGDELVHRVCSPLSVRLCRE